MRFKFKQHIMIARSLLFCIGIMLSCNIYAAADTELPNIFLRIGDIKGESTDNAHLGWIEVFSSSFDISIPLGVSKKSNAIPRAVFGPIGLEKAVDFSTPELFIAVAQGKRFEDVEIEFVADVEATGQRLVYLKVELDQTFVQSLESTLSNGRRVEVITLNFGVITLEYTIINDDGSLGDTIRKTWNVGENSSN